MYVVEGDRYKSNAAFNIRLSRVLTHATPTRSQMLEDTGNEKIKK